LHPQTACQPCHSLPLSSLTPLPPLQPEHITKGYVPRLAVARLPGSYINHYVANGGVVVPKFGYPTDELAVQALQTAYPDRKVVSVPTGTREILLNAGNVHCITQQHVAA
jgi:agmatine deiminase